MINAPPLTQPNWGDDAKYCHFIYIGALQIKTISKNPSWLWKWVGGSKSHSDFVFGKSSQNSTAILE